MIKHFPVMCANVLQKIGSLHYSRSIKIIDCNFGFGGHSHSLLKKFPNAYIQGIDLDPLVIEHYQANYAQDLTESESQRLHITNANFTSIADVKIYPKVDVVLADFGFNSFHLQTQRGFTWQKEQDLDMRYSPSSSTNCSDLVNQASQLELVNILRRFGELKSAKATAEAIIKHRPIKTTIQLRDAVVGSFQQDKPRKIAQVFQAFRIATNQELHNITLLCSALKYCLDRNGMFIGVTFHSLQRDAIHNFLRENKGSFTKAQTVTPPAQEIKINSKSKSAKMLSFRKVG